MNDILNVPQVAELLQCAESTVREHADRGMLPGLKFGRDWVFPAPALMSALTDSAMSAMVARRNSPSTPAHVALRASQPVSQRQPPKLIADQDW